MPRRRLQLPPSSGNPSLDYWLQQLTDTLNTLPSYSDISTTDGPEGVVDATPGTFAADFGSSATTFWVKLSGNTSTGWAEML